MRRKMKAITIAAVSWTRSAWRVCLEAGAGRPALRAAALLWFLLGAVAASGRGQYPFPPAPGAVTGPTLGASIRNAVTATLTQAGLVRKGAYDWGRRAGWATYQGDQFQNDLSNMQLQFQVLRTQFNGLASWVAQAGQPRANNAAAELDGGLNVIAELFTFLSNQYSAGTLDRNTIVRTCRAFEDAMRQWEREFKKNDVRLGVVW